MLLSAGSDCIPFPLTLTLSLGEREHLVGVVTFASGRPANPAQVLANKRRRILPLPVPTAIELSELRQDRSADFSPLPAVLAGPERAGLKSALLNSMAVLPVPLPTRASRGEGENSGGCFKIRPPCLFSPSTLPPFVLPECSFGFGDSHFLQPCGTAGFC